MHYLIHALLKSFSNKHSYVFHIFLLYFILHDISWLKAWWRASRLIIFMFFINKKNTFMVNFKLMKGQAVYAIVNQSSSPPDLCATTCFQRFVLRDQTTTFYFNQTRGCASKGFTFPTNVTYFDKCCDSHNACLNARCCSNYTECQMLKNECDRKYFLCLEKECVLNFNAGSVDLAKCGLEAKFMTNTSISNNACNPEFSVNRKLCYC